jgi:Xaa-Pro aminopeptidase
MPQMLAAPGAMTVDWEERVNTDRLRTYRLGRARTALAGSEVGALLLFDFNNIRYVTSTHIGEWARDKMTRYALLTRGGDPHIWDFGSAARHHRLNCPWLRIENIHAGMVGLRGAVAPDAGLFRAAAREIRDILRAEGAADMPIGVDIVEPPMINRRFLSSAAIFRQGRASGVTTIGWTVGADRTLHRLHDRDPRKPHSV